MKHFWSTTLTSLLLGSTLLFSACKKDKDDDTDNPTPTGSISGKFTPTSAITRVTATNSASVGTSATPGADGTFGINNLNAGNYTVSFTAATGFTAPATRTVAVTAGAINDLGTITVSPGGSGGTGGTMSYKVDGTAVTATLVQGVYTSGALAIAGTTGVGTAGQSVNLAINSITGAGTFPISLLSSNVGTYTANANTWSTILTGSGTIVVSSFNTTTRKASGTFNFVANGFGGATGTKTITNGVFTDASF